MTSERQTVVVPEPRQADAGAPAVVRVESAYRRFDEQMVLEDISLEVSAGQIFGLVGPSGCGKTTLVKLLVGLLRPTDGTVFVNGVEPVDFGTREKRAIGYVPQEFSLYPTLTVWENARFMASIYGLGWLRRRKRIREVLTFLEIWDARKRMAQDLSGGMKRRLSLAGALLHEPQIMVVDEPTAGLDPVLRVRIWEMLRDVRDQGTTVFLTTQYIEEAERCDTVAVMSEGRLAAVQSPLELRRNASLPDVIEIEATDLTPELVESMWRLPSVRGVEWDRSSRLTLRVTEAAKAVQAVEDAFAASPAKLVTIHHRQASFEEVFMRYTGQA